MKTIIKLIISFLLILNISCKKDVVNNDNDLVKFILDSKTENGKVQGFSFENLHIIDFPNSNDIKPDFSVLAQQNDTGFVIGPFLSNFDLTYTFRLTEEFSDLESAKSFYDSYDYCSESIFELHALDIKPYQIWTMKISNDKRGKILILKVKGDEINNTPYAEMEFLADKLK